MKRKQLWKDYYLWQLFYDFITIVIIFARAFALSSADCALLMSRRAPSMKFVVLQVIGNVYQQPSRNGSSIINKFLSILLSQQTYQFPFWVGRQQQQESENEALLNRLFVVHCRWSGEQDETVNKVIFPLSTRSLMCRYFGVWWDGFEIKMLTLRALSSFLKLQDVVEEWCIQYVAKFKYLSRTCNFRSSLDGQSAFVVKWLGKLIGRCSYSS